MRRNFFGLLSALLLPGLRVIAGPWDLSGEVSANYRGIGKHPIEVEIENQLYVSDFYFDFEKFLDKKRYFLEFTANLEGQPLLNQFHLNYLSYQRVDFTFGKFLVPFGRYNELYKPSQVLSITRPLPYASPRSLDFVARLNFAHPIMASGFADFGVKATWVSKYRDKAWIPSQVDLFMTNGLQENPLSGRSFPRSELLGEPTQEKGIQIDYGHEQATLADNNDDKQWGGRARFALGDLRLPFLPEGKNLRGAKIGFSVISSKYDVEDLLDYIYSNFEFEFGYGPYALNGEILYGYNDFRIAHSTAQAISKPRSEHLPKHKEFLAGYYLSNSFQLPRRWLRYESFAYLGLSAMGRYGKQLEFNRFEGIVFVPDDNPRIRKWIYKYTGGLRSHLKEDFFMKIEYSYWDLAPGFEAVDIYQWAISGIVKF